MNFNEQLLAHIPLDKQPLARHVLFVIFDGNTRLWDFFNGDQHMPQFKAELRDVVNEIVRVLISQDIITANYEGENTRLALLKPLLVKYQLNMKDIISKARQYFLSEYSGIGGRAGNKVSIETALNQWQIKFPDLDMNDVPKACKAYIDSVEDPKFIMNMERFILAEDGKSKLANFFDEIDDSEPEIRLM